MREQPEQRDLPDQAQQRVVAVDLGGTNIRAGCVAGEVLHTRSSRPTPAAQGRDAVLTELLAAIAEHVTPDTHAVAIASAGVVDPTDGRICSATDLIPGWAGTPLATHVRERTGLPTTVLNDVHAHAVGEFRHGAGRGARSLLLVAAGTGLGGAVIVDERLVVGSHFVAGHLGHVPCAEASGLVCSCGASGHLESVASGSGLAQLYRRRFPAAPPLTGREIAASDADWATALLESSGRALGSSIGGWCNLLDPDVVVIGGGLAQADDRWWGPLRAAHRRQALPRTRETPIVPAERGDDAALIGAAAWWREGGLLSDARGGGSRP